MLFTGAQHPLCTGQPRGCLPVCWRGGACCRPWQGSPLMLAGVQLLLPQPEWDYLAGRAAAAASFVVQLQGTCRHR
jgi:hypothetical protein